MQSCSLCPETDGKRPMAVASVTLLSLPGSDICTTKQDCHLCADCLDEARRHGDVIGEVKVL